jgi:glycerophosphoryl diester phosphodiesterase
MKRSTVKTCVLLGLVTFNLASCQFFFPGTSAFAATTEKPLLVIGHRGTETTAAKTENSTAAVKAALRAGANGVEVDVRESKDGKLVVMHDESVDRTTNCSGDVEEMTFKALRKCKLSNNDEVIPTPGDIAKTFAKYDSKGDKLWLHIKFKPTAKMRAALFAELDKYVPRTSVVLLADEDEMLDDFAKWSKIERALIFNQTDVDQGGDESWTAGYDYAVPYRVEVTKALVAKAHKAGSKVLAVESNPVARTEVRALGLDGLVANSVSKAIDSLH